MENSPLKLPTHAVDTHDWLELVRKQVAALRFGVGQITVHDSRVVQIETTERLRFEGAKSQTR